MRRHPSTHLNRSIHRERDLRGFSRLVLLLFCGLVLAGGFLFAARQHFAAVQYGYQTEGLRQERDRLLAEEQQLLLSRDQVSAPSRIESVARELGLRPLQAGQVGIPRVGDKSSKAVGKSRVDSSRSHHRQ